MTDTKRRERLGTTDDGEYIVVDLEFRQESGEHQTIEHGTIADPLTVSLSGTIYEKGHREPWGAGQIVSELARITKPAPGWTLDEIHELATLWDRWHLNTLRAACAHMDLPADTGYDARRHIECTQGSGYMYGRSWLTEPVPSDVVERLGYLMRDRSQDLYRARGYDAYGRPVES